MVVVYTNACVMLIRIINVTPNLSCEDGGEILMMARSGTNESKDNENS